MTTVRNGEQEPCFQIYYLSDHPPFEQIDLDPRRRNLYGPNLIFLGDASGETSSQRWPVIDVGPLYTSGRSNLHKRKVHPGLAGRISNVLASDPKGILIVGQHQIALSIMKSQIKFIFDPTDSIALYFARRILPLSLKSPLKAANSLRLMYCFRKLERKILENASCFVTTGVADERYLRRLHPKGNVLRVGNGTEMIVHPPVLDDSDGRTIGFHGGMTWEPNRETVSQLAGPIAAALTRNSGSPVRIRLAGRPIPLEVQACDGKNGVEICGFVEDIRDWLGSLALYVMPMSLGAGVKNKLIEAMAAGIPVLTNARGAESLAAEGKSAVAIAEGTKGIARAIRELLENPEELARMRREGRAYAVVNFDWALHRKRLHDELVRLRRGRRV